MKRSTVILAFVMLVTVSYTLHCAAQPKDQDWSWTMVTCENVRQGWHVTAQGHAVVSIGGNQFVAQLYDAANPTMLYGSLHGKIHNGNISEVVFFKGSETRVNVDYGIPVTYHGTLQRLPYQASENSPSPATIQETITLTSEISFVGLIRETKVGKE